MRRITRGQFLSGLFAPFVAAAIPFKPSILKENYPLLDALNTVTFEELGSGISDSFFLGSSFLTRLRESTIQTHDAGMHLQQPFYYEVVNIHAPSPEEVAWLV